MPHSVAQEKYKDLGKISDQMDGTVAVETRFNRAVSYCAGLAPSVRAGDSRQERERQDCILAKIIVLN